MLQEASFAGTSAAVVKFSCKSVAESINHLFGCAPYGAEAADVIQIGRGDCCMILPLWRVPEFLKEKISEEGVILIPGSLWEKLHF
jgi:hypothetical protein